MKTENLNQILIHTCCAAVFGEFPHAGQCAVINAVFVKGAPNFVERDEPVEQLHILHLGQIACKCLIQMMMRVDQPGVNIAPARINHMISVFFLLSDILNHMVVNQNTSVVNNRVILVNRDDCLCVFNPCCGHDCSSLLTVFIILFE